MAWYWWAPVMFLTYFSLGFAYFPIFEQCVDRTRAQRLVVLLGNFFMPATVVILWVGYTGQALMDNIERNPGSVGCRRLQKVLFWTVYGLPFIWIFSAYRLGRAVLKILRIPDRPDGLPGSFGFDM